MNPESLPDPPTPDDDEARQEFEARAAALHEELKSGLINHFEYERRKSEAWEIYRARSGRLVPDDDESREAGGQPR